LEVCDERKKRNPDIEEATARQHTYTLIEENERYKPKDGEAAAYGEELGSGEEADDDNQSLRDDDGEGGNSQ